MTEQRPASAAKDVLPPIPAGRRSPTAAAAAAAPVGPPAGAEQTHDLGDLPRLWNIVNTASNDLQQNAKKYIGILNKVLKPTYHSTSVDERVQAGRFLLNEGLCKLIPFYWNLLGIASPDDWKRFQDKDPEIAIFRQLLMLVLNTTDTGDSNIITAVNATLMKFMMSLLQSNVLTTTVSSEQTRITGLLVGIVYNCVHKMEDTRTLLRSNDGVSTFCTYSNSADVSIKTDAIIVLSYITNEDEQQQLLTTTHDNIAYILQVLEDCLKGAKKNYQSAKYGYNAREIIDGVNRMALADANKEDIVSCGALPLYEAFLQTVGFDDLMRLACQGLWTLAFNDGNKKKILESTGCMEGLRKLASSSSDVLKKAAQSALWVIEGQEKRVQSISAATPILRPREAKGGLIMLSYNWGVKSAVVKVKDRLKAAGYSVWIDVEQMSGSTLESMSQAIEDAELVLIFFTEKYKLSDSCRLEAEYTFKLGKKFIPVKMEANYRPAGWLGILIGTRLYFDFTKEGQWENTFHALCGELDRLLPQAASADFQGTRVVPETVTNAQQQSSEVCANGSSYPTSNLQCRAWTTSDVQKWLTAAGLADRTELFAKFQGRHVAELYHVLHHTPKIFYEKLAKEPFGLQFFELLSLAAALRELT